MIRSPVRKLNKPNMSQAQSQPTAATSNLTPAADTSLTQPPNENPIIREIIGLLSGIESAIKDCGNIKRENKKTMLANTKKIEQLLLSKPDAVYTPPTTDCSATIDAVRRTIREELAKMQTPTTAPQNAPISFAEVARTQRVEKRTSPTTYKTKPAIIIESKKKVLSPNETLKAFKANVSFRDTNFAPAGVKFVSNNKIRVEFDSNEQREKTLKKINDKPDCPVHAELSKSLRPMIILKGVPADIPAEDLANILKGQNECIQDSITTDEDLLFKFKRRNRNKALYNAVLLASPKVWQAITAAVKLNLDHQRVHAENYVPLLQCFRCLQFGHTKARCTQENSICSHCATPGHDFQSCPSKKSPEEAQCHNCSQHSKATNTKGNVNHSATSNKCPRVQLMSEKIRSRTDYGQ
ncbi:hypothetical protein ABMA28_017314 [Loxostege sticticalis]|uniref:CCHC-type domain-containing protein n=1 Tax=Loxostege sticticalis TaxID=481309 RepID=A0ABD0S1U8_LOXSC